MHSRIHTSGLQQLPHLKKPGPQSIARPNARAVFKDVIREQLHGESSLKISKHAEKRFHAREVTVTPAEWEKITVKVAEAKEKGVKDSIVLTAEAALVVSAINNTVITAMSRQEAAEHIFTNINGTIVI
ncbi:TIGR02530 family flagellar biosynthesis protein [Bacillus piscicola]|uniref:TIGR02530 family flagellar biosynthesis protein n=1 Tax=Bacillus piscicola TaxID=1632684 RepID=UPI001F094338|nr:TIGR02530 family flagellar biosynthesis protein [Bacillus piscicola]